MPVPPSVVPPPPPPPPPSAPGTPPSGGIAKLHQPLGAHLLAPSSQKVEQWLLAPQVSGLQGMVATGSGVTWPVPSHTLWTSTSLPAVHTTGSLVPAALGWQVPFTPPSPWR